MTRVQDVNSFHYQDKVVYQIFVPVSERGLWTNVRVRETENGSLFVELNKESPKAE